MPDCALTIYGKDNYGKPRQEFADRLAVLDEDGFLKQAEQSIWLSAYAANNPRSELSLACRYLLQRGGATREARAIRDRLEASVK